MLDDSNIWVDLIHDTLDIAPGTAEQQPAYFEYLQDENAAVEGRRGLMNHVRDRFVVNQRRKNNAELTWSKITAEEFDGAIAKGTFNCVQHPWRRPGSASRVKDAADIALAVGLFTRETDGRAKAQLVLLGHRPGQGRRTKGADGKPCGIAEAPKRDVDWRPRATGS